MSIHSWQTMKTSPVAMATFHTLAKNARINTSVVNLDSCKKWVVSYLTEEGSGLGKRTIERGKITID